MKNIFNFMFKFNSKKDIRNLETPTGENIATVIATYMSKLIELWDMADGRLSSKDRKEFDDLTEKIITGIKQYYDLTFLDFDMEKLTVSFSTKTKKFTFNYYLNKSDMVIYYPQELKEYYSTI